MIEGLLSLCTSHYDEGARFIIAPTIDHWLALSVGRHSLAVVGNRLRYKKTGVEGNEWGSLPTPLSPLLADHTPDTIYLGHEKFERRPLTEELFPTGSHSILKVAYSGDWAHKFSVCTDPMASWDLRSTCPYIAIWETANGGG